jgi:hypothetical protein
MKRVSARVRTVNVKCSYCNTRTEELTRFYSNRKPITEVLFGKVKKTVQNRRKSSHVYFNVSLLKIFGPGLEINYLIPLRMSLTGNKYQN